MRANLKSIEMFAIVCQPWSFASESGAMEWCFRAIDLFAILKSQKAVVWQTAGGLRHCTSENQIPWGEHSFNLSLKNFTLKVSLSTKELLYSSKSRHAVPRQVSFSLFFFFFFFFVDIFLTFYLCIYLFIVKVIVFFPSFPMLIYFFFLFVWFFLRDLKKKIFFLSSFIWQSVILQIILFALLLSLHVLWCVFLLFFFSLFSMQTDFFP